MRAKQKLKTRNKRKKKNHQSHSWRQRQWNIGHIFLFLIHT